MYPQLASAEGEDKMKISSEQKADIVRRIQVKNPDGTWAVSYKELATEFGVSRCLISHIAKHAGLARRERGRFAPHIAFVGKRYQPPTQLSDMYQELRSKVGVTEARRLIEDHMRIRRISYGDVGRGSSFDVQSIAA
jgi:AraC-like DNA-binding protein